MDAPRPVRVVLVVLVTAVVVLLVAPHVVPSPSVEESTYGYSVSVATNATLSNVTLYVPLPTSGGGASPVVEAVATGAADAPEGWRYDVIETDSGPMLRVRADEVPAERRADGNRYSAYQLGVSVPAGHVVDTADPLGEEPTLAPVDGRRSRPCPNVVAPGDGTCFAFDARVYAAYEAPPDADVGIYLVHSGATTYTGPDRSMYYERLHVAFDGPQDGWTTVDGFVSVDDD